MKQNFFLTYANIVSKSNFVQLKTYVTFLSMYSYEFAHLAKFFIGKTLIYFQNEHRLFFLLFPPNVLLVPQN